MVNQREADAAVHLAVDSANGSAHGVDATLTVGIRVDNLPGELHELKVVRRQFSTRNQYLHTPLTAIRGLKGVSSGTVPQTVFLARFAGLETRRDGHCE